MNDGFDLPPSSSPAGAGEQALPIVVVGHVDHGKSTLVGRLLHDTGSLPPGRIEQVRAISAKRGLDLELSFLLDSLQVERDQGITVDAAQIWFRTAKRRYVIIDAPGHTEFLRNMVTGAAAAEAAVLVVDAQQGVAEQTRRHGYLLGILGVVLCQVLGPFAWVIGKRTLGEIDASHGRLGGRGQAQAGYVLGIVGTVLLVLSVLAILIYVAFIAIVLGGSLAYD